MLHDVFSNHVHMDESDHVGEFSSACDETTDTHQFDNILREADGELYPGSRKKRLDFVVKLYQSKLLYGMSDAAFGSVLALIREHFPMCKTLPPNLYYTKKIIRALGLDYHNIDACRNNCMLFWKEHVNAIVCAKCGASRYKQRKGNSGTIQCTKRHHADSSAWKHLDNTYPYFARECRNVHLGLASDGFNPFGKTSPSNAIDVFLQPTIDDLQHLWMTGLRTYDSHCQETFTMRATLLWTINDFPAYAMLSGWSTSGEKTCLTCGDDTDSLRLKHGKKLPKSPTSPSSSPSWKLESLAASFPWVCNATIEQRRSKLTTTGRIIVGPDQTLALIRFDLIDVRLGGGVERDGVVFGVWGVKEERRFGWVGGVEEGKGKVDVREVKWRRGLGGCR
ncbi:hypothetical protein ACFXTN_017329 [Malus domestica]